MSDVEIELRDWNPGFFITGVGALLSADLRAMARAAGRVLRVQGCPFSGKMPLGIPKKRVKPKKAFHFSSKKRSAPKEARQRRVREAVLRVQGCPFFYSMSTASHRCMESPTPHSACVLCIWMQKWLLSSVPSSMNLPNVTMTF